MDSRRRGITLIETIMALSLITIAALGLIAALTRLMIAQSSSSHQTVARMIADSKLQGARIVGPPNFHKDVAPDPPYVLGDIGSVRVVVGQNAEEVEFFFQLSAEEVLPPTSFDIPANPSMGKMWEVTIRVWWNNDNAYEGAVERGTETIEVTTLTYIET